ncbi:MAG: hypothetical protein FK733_09190 [Asgard group archaeon]|nr:hypothetical protein [Asgard group archaeon]
MTEETNNTSQRLNQWFVRGIGFVVSGLFALILTITLLDLDQALFSQDMLPSIDINYVLLAKNIGSYLWTFRVYDLLLVIILLILASISAYYLLSYKSVVKPSRQQQRRYRF